MKGETPGGTSRPGGALSPGSPLLPGDGEGFVRNLLTFGALLRVLEVKVSTAELMDALAALRKVGLADRNQVKVALAATLIKDARDAPLFAALFDAFFVPPEERRRQISRRVERLAARHEGVQRAGEELRLDDDGPTNLDGKRRETYSGLPDDERERIRHFLRRSPESGETNESLESVIRKIVADHLDERRLSAAIGRPGREPLSLGDESLDACLEEVSMSLAGEGGSLLFARLEEIDESQLPYLEVLIRAISRRLATMISRRYRLSRRRPVIDIRKTIRGNIGSGGVLFRLHYRSRRVRKPRLLLINDVSGSMARYAEFVTLFIHGLSSVTGRVEVFIFSEDLERVTDRLASGSVFRQAMGRLLEGTSQWGRGTSLGQALSTLVGRHEDLLTPATVVIILSDTKTLAVAQALTILEEMGEKVRDILWLNPLPASEWDLVPTVKTFQGVARMYECCTVADLERVLREAVLPDG
jgi:uncharacterized protein with von Willebrand factor type A (vWA) domain